MTTLLESMIAYENGELDEDEFVHLFQVLVDTGLAWQLQGSYGRTAQYLIFQGLVHQHEPTVEELSEVIDGNPWDPHLEPSDD